MTSQVNLFNDEENPVNKIIRQMQRRDEDLKQLAIIRADSTDWVIWLDDLFVHYVDAGGEHKRAFAAGVETATTLTKAQAERLARYVSNGNGTRGKPMRMQDALALSRSLNRLALDAVAQAVRS